jgi:phosphoglycolate phosphatase-like HAD superfamily hydrolase
VPADPLPSWNKGAARARLLDFVKRITRAPDLVPPSDRIAVFDNDGTLWPEQPTCIQFIFAFERLKSLSHANPDLSKAEPFRTVLEGGLDRLATLDEAGIIEIIKATHSGMSTEQFSAIVANWLHTAKDPRFGRPYADLVYQPMLELIDYLGANEFKVFIVSGNGADFIRVFADQTYRIPPERVVGSTTVVEFTFGKAGPLLMKMPEIEVLGDGPGKPEAIERFIGRRPIFGFGNSDGDREMLEWTAAGSGVRFVGLLHHTDAKREWAYSQNLLELARVQDWTIVDIAADWNIVFPFQHDTAVF